MKQKTAYTRCLRRSRTSAFASLFAMLFQILFAVEHASAMAVAAAQGGADGAPLGFLDICTARGLLRIPAPAGTSNDEQPAPRSGGGESCAVCGTAAVSGATHAPTVSVIVTPPHFNMVAITPPPGELPHSIGFKRSGSTRGPPAISPLRTL